jgi:hypothetical protein
MPRFILITDSPNHSHATPVSRDEIVDLLRGPCGYSDVARCLEMIEAPTKMSEGAKGYMPFPLHPAPWGVSTIHIEGLMDFERERFSKPCDRCQVYGKPCAHRRPIEWKEAGHRCDLGCALGVASKRPRPGAVRPGGRGAAGGFR